MVHAKSSTLQAREELDLKESLYQKATKLYLELQDGPASAKKSYAAVIDQVLREHASSGGKPVKLSSSTLHDRVHGMKSKSESALERSWINKTETNIIIQFAIESAHRGFPLTPQHLRERVNEIAQQRHGDKLPADGVGQNWVDRFIERNHKSLHKYLSRPLDSKRAQGANPVNNAEWFKILGETIQNYTIEPDCIYACDETGFLMGEHTRQTVIGPPGQKLQHEQHGENRENVTVLPTICADGSSLPPLVIFKSGAFFSSWRENDPLNAMLGHSKKGWTNGEICASWIKHFDKLTRDKADGRARLLLVDGHRSRFTLELLTYARQNNIHILCYPSHATHIYQGLDVACFSPLKRAYSEERSKYEQQTGKRVEKSSFLRVYGPAHIRTFKPETIQSAFRKTGVVPFDPSVISAEQLAPSRTSALTSELPLPQPTPVRAIVRLLRTVRESADSSRAGSEQPSQGASARNSGRGSPMPSLSFSSSSHQIPDSSIDPQLLQDTLGAIDNSLGVNSASSENLQIPSIPNIPHPPALPPIEPALLNFEPQTERERELQALLQASNNQLHYQQGIIDTLHAQTILQGTFVGHVNTKLQNLALKEVERRSKGKKREKLIGSGRPAVLTSDELHDALEEQKDEKDAAEKAKEERREDKQLHQKAMAVWAAKNKVRVDANKLITEEYRKAVEKWQKRKEQAKAKGKTFKELKPKRGPLMKADPKPVPLYSRKRHLQRAPIVEEGEDFTGEINLVASSSSGSADDNSSSEGDDSGSEESGEESNGGGRDD